MELQSNTGRASIAGMQQQMDAGSWGQAGKVMNRRAEFNLKEVVKAWKWDSMQEKATYDRVQMWKQNMKGGNR